MARSSSNPGLLRSVAAIALGALRVGILYIISTEVYFMTGHLRYRSVSFNTGDGKGPGPHMKAAVYVDKGAPSEVLHIVPVESAFAAEGNVPPHGMVVVKVTAAALNPIDFKLMRSSIPFGAKIAGCDLAGVVASTGTGVTNLSPGDKVFGMLPIVGGSGWGSLAEYVIIDASVLAKAPHSVPLEDAAALPLVSLTVFQVFEDAGIRPERREEYASQTIFIQAGSGGVGSIALQYARNILGFKNVITTCSERNLEKCYSLGATSVIDYRKKDFGEVVRDADVVLDPLAYLFMEKTINPRNGILRPGGQYLHIMSSAWAESSEERNIFKVFHGAYFSWMTYVKHLWDSTSIRVHSSMVQPGGEKLKIIARLVDDGKLKPVVGRVFEGLGESQDALAFLATGHAVGKVLVKINHPKN